MQFFTFFIGTIDSEIRHLFEGRIVHNTVCCNHACGRDKLTFKERLWTQQHLQLNKDGPSNQFRNLQAMFSDLQTIQEFMRNVFRKTEFGI